MFIELTRDELNLLEEVVREFVSELRAEIAGTESYDFRQGLKKKEETLQSILAKLEKTHLVVAS